MSPEPTPLPDDVERAIPRGSRVPWERRLLRLVEPADPAAPVASPEPVPAVQREPTTVAEAEEAVRWAQTSSEYDRAVATLTKLQSGPAEAAEPAPAPPAVAPPTRTVLIKEVLERDSAGLISKIKEYQITEPLPPDGAPAPERPPNPL